jgi:hypothetical protein
MDFDGKFRWWHNVLCAWCDERSKGNARFEGEWFASCGIHGDGFEPFDRETE